MKKTRQFRRLVFSHAILLRDRRRPPFSRLPSVSLTQPKGESAYGWPRETGKHHCEKLRERCRLQSTSARTRRLAGPGDRLEDALLLRGGGSQRDRQMPMSNPRLRTKGVESEDKAFQRSDGRSTERLILCISTRNLCWAQSHAHIRPRDTPRTSLPSRRVHFSSAMFAWGNSLFPLRPTFALPDTTLVKYDLAFEHGPRAQAREKTDQVEKQSQSRTYQSPAATLFVRYLLDRIRV